MRQLLPLWQKTVGPIDRPTSTQLKQRLPFFSCTFVVVISLCEILMPFTNEQVKVSDLSFFVHDPTNPSGLATSNTDKTNASILSWKWIQVYLWKHISFSKSDFYLQIVNAHSCHSRLICENVRILCY